MTSINLHSTRNTAIQKRKLRGPVRHLSHLILLFIASISATGCIAMNDTEKSTGSFRDQQSTAEARAQLEKWITPGISITEAVSKLESQGFHCQNTMPPSRDIKSSFFCIYSTPPPSEDRIVTPQAPVSWTVSLDSEDGTTVRNFQVTRSFE